MVQYVGMSIRTDVELVNVTSTPVIVDGPLPAMPSGFPPTQGRVHSALHMPVTHVDRSTQAIMRQPATPTAKPVEQPAVHAIDPRIDALERRIDELMAMDGELSTSGNLFNKKKKEPASEPKYVMRYEVRRGVYSVVNPAELKQLNKEGVLYAPDERPQNTLFQALGKDSDLSIKVELKSGHFKAKHSVWADVAKDPNARSVGRVVIDVGDTTGGVHGKALLKQVGAFFVGRLMGGDFIKPESKWLHVRDQDVFYICTQSDYSFFRIVASLRPDYEAFLEFDSSKDDFKNLVVGTLLGTKKGDATVAEWQKPNETFYLPMQFKGATHNYWMYKEGELNTVDFVAVPPPKKKQDPSDVIDGVPVPQNTPPPDNTPTPPYTNYDPLGGIGPAGVKSS